MRVLQVNSFSCFSTGSIMLGIHGQLSREGCESYFAYGRGPCLNDPFGFKIANSREVYFDALLTRLDDRCGFHSQRATKRLINLIERVAPDILHLHIIHGYYLNVEMLFLYIKQKNLKVIWTLHDCWAFTGHCGFFTYKQCDKWLSECSNCPNKSEYPKSVFLDSSCLNFNRKKLAFSGVKNLTIVTPSRWLANLVQKSFLGEYPIKVVPNGIDTDVFKPSPSELCSRYGIKDKKIVLGVASTWENRKGLRDLVWLSRNLPNEFEVVVIGLTQNQIKELPSQMLGLTRTNSRSELAEWYSLAFVLANPTYEDNYPTVNLEAQSCGTPVISYDTGGCLDTLTGSSLAVPYGDKQSLREAITKHDGLFESTDIDFSNETRLRKYLEIYSELQNM